MGNTGADGSAGRAATGGPSQHEGRDLQRNGQVTADNNNGSNGNSSVLSDLVLFAKNFLKYPNDVGWMLPSSPWVVNDVLKQIDWERAKVIVEYGPGVGTFTTKLLQRMRPDATLVALEINPNFCEHLSRTINDPRFKLINESAAEVGSVLSRLGFAHADYILSGIPFKTLPHDLRGTIVQNTYSVLAPTGNFLVYQLSSAVLPYLEKVFGKVSRQKQLLSFIPAQMFYCSRNGGPKPA